MMMKEELEFKIKILEKRVDELEKKIQDTTTQEFNKDEIRKLKKLAQRCFS